MSGSFTAINLDNLPFPNVVETLDYETLLAEIKVQLLAIKPDMADVLELESEPTTKLLEITALREMVIRQRVNDASKAVMLAYADKANLENLGAFYSVERLLITPADPGAYPPVEAVYETDADYRRRIQLSVEAHTTAGPTGAYLFHTLSADPTISDADIYSPTPGQVEVTVLTNQGNGEPDQTLLDTVEAALNDEFVRPLNDQVFVLPAQIVNYNIIATLTYFNGPDPAVVKQTAETAINNYVANKHRMGNDITVSGIHAALHQEGIQNVVLAEPLNDIVIDHNQAAFCTGITLIEGGTDE